MVLLPLVLVASRQCAATVTRPCIFLLKVEASAYILMRFDSEYQHFRVRVEQRPQAMQKGKRRDTACLAFRRDFPRSEEHTSELQSLRHLVCRLLLEKKKPRQCGAYSTLTEQACITTLSAPATC